MIASYLNAAIRQAKERAKVLKGKIPNPAPTPELNALQHICIGRIDSLIAEFEYLLTDRAILSPAVVRERVRMFRRALGDLTGLETTGVAALNRANADDIVMNKLVFQIHQEIKYPLAPPTVSCLSRSYFCIIPGLHLLQVHPAESDFLLHLPDLYHELAHPILVTENDPRVEQFQKECVKFFNVLAAYFEQERIAAARTTGPKDFLAFELDVLERSWAKWVFEIFCDLYALFTLGPAFAWAHFHLTATQGGDPFDVSTVQASTHPPDQARMETLLIGLGLMGMKHEAKAIEDKWNALLQAVGSKPNANYRKAFPRNVLEQAAVHAFEGTKRIGSRVVTAATKGGVHELLSKAWETFWAAPEKYPEWERKEVSDLKAKLQPQIP